MPIDEDRGPLFLLCYSNAMTTLYEKIYQATQLIPTGKVATYGSIAKISQTHPRVVGNALHRNPRPIVVPCHRVVNAAGQLAAHFGMGGAQRQKELLEQEGIAVSPDYQVDLTHYEWQENE